MSKLSTRRRVQIKRCENSSGNMSQSNDKNNMINTTRILNSFRAMPKIVLKETNYKPFFQNDARPISENRSLWKDSFNDVLEKTPSQRKFSQIIDVHQKKTKINPNYEQCISSSKANKNFSLTMSYHYQDIPNVQSNIEGNSNDFYPTISRQPSPNILISESSSKARKHPHRKYRSFFQIIEIFTMIIILCLYLILNDI